MTVAELGQLTRAGEALHISQPAVTAQIKALEDEFQVSLFERTSSGMVLTKAGHRLLLRAEEVLRAVQKLKNESKALLGEVAGKVGVGTLSSPDVIRLGDFLSTMVERYPLVELELHHQVSGMAAEHVRDGTLDASFYYGDMNHPSLQGIPLRDMVYRVTAPVSWRDKVEDASWSDIAALPWILAPSISTHNSLLRGFFAEQGVEPTKVVEADHESVINSLIVSGVGISLMLEEQALAAVEEGDVVIWGEARLSTKLWFIHSAERAQDPVIRALLEIIRETWNLEGDDAAAAIRIVRQASGKPLIGTNDRSKKGKVTYRPVEMS